MKHWDIAIMTAMIVILSIMLISAVPPVTQVQEFTEGYIIKGTPQTYLKQSTTFNFSFFVYNISNGVPITDSETECFFYMENSEGKLQANIQATYLPLNYWEVEIDSNNFTLRGIYPYSVNCNSTLFGGAYTGLFEVTGTGKELSQPTSIMYIIFFGILLLLFMITLGLIPLLPYRNESDTSGNILSVSKLKYLRSVLWVLSYGLLMAIMFISSGLAMAYLENDAIGNLFFTIYRIMFIMMTPMAILWILYIFTSIFRDREMKRMLEGGIQPELDYTT